MALPEDHVVAGTGSDKAPAQASPSSSSKDFVPLSPNDDKALMRKIDLTLLPGVTILYLLSFLDRSNVANARIEGLTDDLGMSGNQYLTGLTLFFIGYVIFEVPCNIVLKRTTPKMWLPTLTLAFGIVSTLQGVTQSLAGFYIVRFFLGVAESGLFPGVVFYMSMWYKRNEQHYRVALFFSAASLAGAFGGILAYGIAHMDGVGGYRGWRWIFILEYVIWILLPKLSSLIPSYAVAAPEYKYELQNHFKPIFYVNEELNTNLVIVSFAAYFFISNYPATAAFLSAKERNQVQLRLKHDNDATRKEEFAWNDVTKAFKDYKCWLYGLGFHTMSLPLYTLSLFLPTIIRELGFTAAQAQLLSIPPYAIATTLTVIVAILSERYRFRAPFIMATSSLAIIGYIVLLSAPSTWASYGGTVLAAAGIYPSCAIVLSWPANNVSGQTKRATANAMQISIGNLGAVLGTQLYRTETAPRFFLGHGFALGYLVANVLVVGCLWLVLRRENIVKDKALAERGTILTSEDEWQGDEDIRWKFQT